VAGKGKRCPPAKMEAQEWRGQEAFRQRPFNHQQWSVGSRVKRL